MEKSMEVPKGTKTRSTIFSSPTPRHISTKIITEQDTCTVCAHISVCARGCARARAFAGEDGGGGGAGAGAGTGAAPWDCLRHAKEPQTETRDGRLVSWKPNAEGLGGRAEATQVCSGSQCPGHPAPGGAGAAGAQELGRGAGAKGEGRQRAYSTRYTQAVSHPSTNQARPCLASEIR